MKSHCSIYLIYVALSKISLFIRQSLHLGHFTLWSLGFIGLNVPNCKKYLILSSLKFIETISVINQLNEEILVLLISLLYASTCFEHCCTHHQEVKIVLYSIWYHHTCTWPSGAQIERGPVHRMIPHTV